MIQLGISAFYHDSAACLIKDGKVLGAIEEEKFTGIKHDMNFPINSINWLLSEFECNTHDINEICWYENPDLKRDRILSIFKKYPIKNFWNRIKFIKRHKIEGDIHAILIKYLQYDGKVTYVSHHLSHAAFSYYTSPFKKGKTIIVTIDGVGEWDTSAVYLAENGKIINKVIETTFPNSIGMLYSTFTAFLGFAPNEGEYKVMGLAGYGNKSNNPYYNKIMELITLNNDGSFEINQKYFTWEYSDKIMFNDSLCEYLQLSPRTKDTVISTEYMDLAYAIQMVYENVFRHIISTMHKKYGVTQICLGGGCAYNGIANTIAYEYFKNVWIPFAPSDSGSAIGACLSINKEMIEVSPYIGPNYKDYDLSEDLIKKSNYITWKHMKEDEIIEQVANDIHKGDVIGWFQGAMEFGARALGNRSILASPLGEHTKDRLNTVIKKREGFRPFAPSCIEEEANNFFNIPEPVPYMNQIVHVKDNKMPAITHVDGTARVQTVTQKQNDKYYRLLKKLGELSGYPICLNTSFNFKDQTITMTPAQAIDRFLDCEMDSLVINNTYITKK